MTGVRDYSIAELKHNVAPVCRRTARLHLLVAAIRNLGPD
jgi:hypothetical protein